VIRIVSMRPRHLGAVLRIENELFPEPWSESLYRSELAQRAGRAYLVAKEGRMVLGYIGVLFAPGEAHVATIAVTQCAQGKGIGTRLMYEGTKLATRAGAQRFILEVATGNERAQLLYNRFGFVPVHVRKGYYQKSGEDAYVMIASDLTTPKYEERLREIEASLS